MKCLILLSRKNKKNINLSSAESAHSVVSVKSSSFLVTLKVLNKTVADDILIFYYHFSDKIKALSSRQFTWNVKPYFLWKILQKFKISAAEVNPESGNLQIMQTHNVRIQGVGIHKIFYVYFCIKLYLVGIEYNSLHVRKVFPISTHKICFGRQSKIFTSINQ